MIDLTVENVETAAIEVLTSIIVILKEVAHAPDRFGYAHMPDAARRARELIEQMVKCRIAARSHSDFSMFEYSLEDFRQFYDQSIPEDK